jgi:hypothetical protein
MIIDTDLVITYLKDANLEPTSNNINALAGMLSLEVFPPDQCIADLKAYIECGATWV